MLLSLSSISETVRGECDKHLLFGEVNTDDDDDDDDDDVDNGDDGDGDDDFLYTLSTIVQLIMSESIASNSSLSLKLLSLSSTFSRVEYNARRLP